MATATLQPAQTALEVLTVDPDHCGLTDNFPLVTHATLDELEQVIESGKLTYIAVGDALREIRDRKLYKEYGTFEAYCHERWGFSRATAYRNIQAADVARVRQNAGEEIPASASQALGRTYPKKEGVPAPATPAITADDQLAADFDNAVPDAPVEIKAKPEKLLFAKDVKFYESIGLTARYKRTDAGDPAGSGAGHNHNLTFYGLNDKQRAQLIYAFEYVIEEERSQSEDETISTIWDAIEAANIKVGAA